MPFTVVDNGRIKPKDPNLVKMFPYLTLVTLIGLHFGSDVNVVNIQ